MYDIDEVKGMVSALGPNLDAQPDDIESARILLDQGTERFTALSEDIATLVSAGVSDEAVFGSIFTAVLFDGPDLAIAALAHALLTQAKALNSAITVEFEPSFA